MSELLVCGVWICKYVQIVLHQKHSTHVNVWLFFITGNSYVFCDGNQMQKYLVWRLASGRCAR